MKRVLSAAAWGHAALPSGHAGRVTLPVLAAVVGVMMLTGSALADTSWKSDVYSGSWTNAANWTDGVPDASTIASIENNGADYTVTIDSDAMLYATNTTVGNTGGTTTLYIDSPITFFPGLGAISSSTSFFQQNDGTKTIVRSGGRMEFDGPEEDAGKLAINRSSFVIDGGTVDLSGVSMVRLSGTAATSAELVITNGGSMMLHSTANVYNRHFEVNPNTRLHIHNGTFSLLQNRSFYYSSPFKLWGGRILVSGTGVFEGQAFKAYSTLPLQNGSVSFTDNATLNVSGLLLAPQTDSQTVTVSFSGNSTITNSYGYAETIIGDSHGRSVFDWNSSASPPAPPRNVYVGLNCGYGELNIRNGYLFLGNFKGVHVGVGEARVDYDQASYRSWGGAQINDPAQFAPTGVLRVAGGALCVNATFSGAGYNSKPLYGLIIGDAAKGYDSYSGRPCNGLLELSSGCVTNAIGNFVLGYGRAVGRMVQTDGEFYRGALTSPAWNNHYAAVVGLAGGDGNLVMSNGVFTVYGHIMVGGAAFDDLGAAPSVIAETGIYPKNARNAKGVMTLACHDKSKPCTVKIYYHNNAEFIGKQGVWIGRDGDGTLEFIGSGSTLELPSMNSGFGLTLTNGFAAVYGEQKADGTASEEGEILTHGQATLRFVFDKDGTGLLDSRNAAVKIAPNARLEVDMSAYKGAEKTVTLLKCKSRDRDFAPENMVLKNCIIIQSATAIKAKYYKRGMDITFR